MEMAPYVEELKASNYSCRVYTTQTEDNPRLARRLLSSLTNAQLQSLTDDFENQTMPFNNKLERTEAEKRLVEAFRYFQRKRASIELERRISANQIGFNSKDLQIASYGSLINLLLVFCYLEGIISQKTFYGITLFELAVFFLVALDKFLKRSYRRRNPEIEGKNGGIWDKLKECGAWFKETRCVNSVRQKWIRMFPSQERRSREEHPMELIS